LNRIYNIARFKEIKIMLQRYIDITINLVKFISILLYFIINCLIFIFSVGGILEFSKIKDYRYFGILIAIHLVMSFSTYFMFGLIKS